MRPTFILLAAVLSTTPAFAQSTPSGSAEAIAGWAGFVDDALINHGVVGGSARFHLTPRVSIGPELVYMRGPNTDRDLFLTGNITFDFRVRAAGSRAGLVSPFLVAGGGFMSHSTDFPSGTFTSYEGAFTAGGGARAWLSDRLYILGEVRTGWELHTRVTGGAGWAW
jgi:hypothetical protein